MSGGHLSGSRWILTRPRNRAASWCDALTIEGAEVLLAPALELVEAESESVRSSLANFSQDGLLVFTSATTVQHFFSLIEQEDHHHLKSVHWAAVGPATAAAIRAGGYEVDVEGQGMGAEELVTQVISTFNRCEVIHYTSDAGLPIIIDRLSAAEFTTSRVEASKTQVEADLDPKSWKTDVQGSWSGIIFSSPASVRAVLSRAGDTKDSLLEVPAVAAGVTPANELPVQGWAQIEIAERATSTDLVVACANLLGGGTMKWSR